LKNIFKRKHNPQPEPAIDKAVNEPSRTKVLVDIPNGLAERGVLIRIDRNGPRPVQEEGPVIESLGVPVTVLYDPHSWGSAVRRPWVVQAKLTFNYKGQCFGVDGPALVKSIGLEFPNALTPWAEHVEISADGFVMWARLARPEAEDVVKFVQEAQRQVERIMKHYGETKEILAVLEKAANK